MIDAELIAWLRDLAVVLGKEAFTCAADRIEALVKERDGYKNICEQREEIIAARTDRYKVAEARAERLEAALREIESISVHSGGEVHGVTALQWELAFAHAQDIASAALK